MAFSNNQSTLSIYLSIHISTYTHKYGAEKYMAWPKRDLAWWGVIMFWSHNDILVSGLSTAGDIVISIIATFIHQSNVHDLHAFSSLTYIYINIYILH